LDFKQFNLPLPDKLKSLQEKLNAVLKEQAHVVSQPIPTDLESLEKMQSAQKVIIFYYDFCLIKGKFEKKKYLKLQ